MAPRSRGRPIQGPNARHLHNTTRGDKGPIGHSARRLQFAFEKRKNCIPMLRAQIAREQTIQTALAQCVADEEAKTIAMEQLYVRICQSTTGKILGLPLRNVQSESSSDSSDDSDA